MIFVKLRVYGIFQILRMRKKAFLTWLAVFVLIGGFLLSKFWFWPNKTPVISRDAENIFVENTSLQKYITEYGVRAAVERIAELSSKYGDCHTRAHQLGRIAYEMVGDKAFKECSAECHSGCYHGATEAYFKEHGTTDLAQNLNTLCGNELNFFFSHQCIHGIGHGLMAWSNYEIVEALKGCDLLDRQRDSCWTGVFMENIVGGLTEEEDSNGHFTKYLSEDPHYPCDVVDEKYRSSCYFLQTSRMVQLFNYDFSKVAKECSKAPKKYQQDCFLSMGRDIGGIYRNNPKEATRACLNAPEGNMRTYCLNGAIQDTFWDPSGQDLAIEFCRTLTNKDKDDCYDVIFKRAPQVLPTKSELKIFCSKVEKEYQEKCPL